MGLQLQDGDQVCIVGGGPAGSFAALHLLEYASRMGLRLKVKIFEPRDFSKPGPGGCNRCAGVLSSRLLQGLETLGLEVPAEVVQAELHRYAVHLDGELIQIQQPDPSRRIVSIYRGGGPRLVTGDAVASFDKFLLDRAVAQGVTHIPRRVRRVTWEGRPVVNTARDRYPAKFLILATGVNSRPPMAPCYGYLSPPSQVMAQDEIHLPPGWPPGQVSAFFNQPPGLTFGALIPKGDYLNISLLGKGFTIDSVEDFIELQGLGEQSTFGEATSLCGCTPRIAVGPARRYFGDRWVAVGDAAATRLYKDGIGSAFFTAQRAMSVATNHGITRGSFQQGYAPLIRQITRDNRYGRLLFFMWDRTIRISPLQKAWVQAIRRELSMSPEERIHIRILWGMFTGDEPYRDLFWLSLHRKALKGLLESSRTTKRRTGEG